MTNFIEITHEGNKELINIDSIQRIRKYSGPGKEKTGLNLRDLFVLCEETVEEIVRKIEESKK